MFITLLGSCQNWYTEMEDSSAQLWKQFSCKIKSLYSEKKGFGTQKCSQSGNNPEKGLGKDEIKNTSRDLEN